MIQINKLSINAIGKIKKPWIINGINQYKKRMPELKINELKSFKLLNLDYSNSNKNIIICLSEEGKLFNSEEFTLLIESFQNQKVSFLIGDADGLPSSIKSNADLLLSLSPFTFPHELARLILVEQIYRAFSISHKYPYHRS